MMKIKIEDVDEIGNTINAMRSCIARDNDIGAWGCGLILVQQVDNIILRSKSPNCCGKCGGRLEIDETVVYTSFPPKYKAQCLCGHVQYVTCGELNEII